MLAALAADPGPDNLLLVVTTRPEKEVWSSAWLKAFEKHGVFVQTWPVEIKRLPAWIAERAARLGIAFERGAAELLAERVEGNLLAAQQELEKLALLHPGARLDIEAVQAAVANSARYDVFQLGEAALAGDARAIAQDPRGAARRRRRAAARPVGAVPGIARARGHAQRRREEGLWRGAGAPRGAGEARGEAHRGPADRALVRSRRAHRPPGERPVGIEGRPLDLADWPRRLDVGRAPAVRDAARLNPAMRPFGVFGGMFDPIHYGHLRTAHELHELLGLEAVAFVPAGDPPHRAAPLADAATRLEMVRAAVGDDPRFLVDDRELRRAGPSYTILTLEELRAERGAQPHRADPRHGRVRGHRPLAPRRRSSPRSPTS